MIKAGRARAPAMVTVEDPWFVKERMANGTRWPDQIEWTKRFKRKINPILRILPGWHCEFWPGAL